MKKLVAGLVCASALSVGACGSGETPAPVWQEPARLSVDCDVAPLDIETLSFGEDASGRVVVVAGEDSAIVVVDGGRYGREGEKLYKYGPGEVVTWVGRRAVVAAGEVSPNGESYSNPTRALTLTCILGTVN